MNSLLTCVGLQQKQAIIRPITTHKQMKQPQQRVLPWRDLRAQISLQSVGPYLTWTALKLIGFDFITQNVCLSVTTNAVLVVHTEMLCLLCVGKVILLVLGTSQVIVEVSIPDLVNNDDGMCSVIVYLVLSTRLRSALDSCL